MTIVPDVRQKAEDAFSQARRRVFFQRILGFFSGHQSGSLLSFEHVRGKLKVRGQHYMGLQEIPIDKIVGTTGRYQEFNRDFLPTQDFLRDRWKRVYEAAHAEGFPPIDVYQIGDAYFVRDGHIRVSVLKELGAKTVEARVIQLDTPVPFASDTTEEDLERKEEHALFLQETGLDRLRPEQGIEFTRPGQYQKLFEHIAAHRHFLGLSEDRVIPYDEAVARWYDDLYRPSVMLIREEQILEQFPDRTEADLYMWLIEDRQFVEERYGQPVPLEQAVAEFSIAFSPGVGKKRLEAEVKRTKAGGQRPAKTNRIVAVFGSGSAPPESPVLVQAEHLGRLLAEAGFTVMCGGYGGTMEAVSRGAYRAGGQVIGVTMDLFSPDLEANPWLTKEHRVKDFFPRLNQLTSADAFVVLQGAIGTLTEATLTWSLLQTGQISPRPFLFVGASWHRLFDSLRAETLMTERDFALATVVGDQDEALALLVEALAPAP